MDEHRRWKCKQCDHICRSADLLHAPHPFDKDDVVVGCPNCKSVDSFTAACDVDGCRHESSSGTPTTDGSYGGYTYRCHEHRL